MPHMTLPLRLPALGPRTKVALGFAAALVLLVILFDWNWFRPLLERHLSESAQRRVHAADVHVFLEPDLNGIHGLDERIRVKALYEGRDYLFDLVKAYAG